MQYTYTQLVVSSEQEDFQDKIDKHTVNMEKDGVEITDIKFSVGPNGVYCALIIGKQ